MTPPPTHTHEVDAGLVEAFLSAGWVAVATTPPPPPSTRRPTKRREV